MFLIKLRTLSRQKKWVKKSYNELQKNFKKNGNFVNQWEFSFLKRFNFHHVKSTQLVVNKVL